MTLWHPTRDSRQQLAALEPFRGASVRVRPQVFAMNGSVAAILVSFVPGSVSRESDGTLAESWASAEGAGGRVGGGGLDGAGEQSRIPCFNSHPHVTLWIAKKGMAYLSNALLARLVSPEVGPPCLVRRCGSRNLVASLCDAMRGCQRLT